jgi:cell volume regulation protein A
MDVAIAGHLSLVVALVVLAAVVGVRIAARIGLPGLLLYLALGLALGAPGLGGIEFDDAQLATALGYLALIVILAEGGLTTRPANVRPVLLPATALASLGVVISIVLVAVPTHLILGLDLRTATLIGAVLAPTDAAAVFTVARGLRLPPRLQTILEAESGLNDAPVVVVVVLLSTTATHESAWLVPLVIALELLGGVIVGAGVGFAARWMLPRLALPAAGLYPVAVLALVLLSYGLAAVLHASGFAAVYVTSLMLAAAQLPHRRAVLGFVEGIAWSVKIGMFVMLGVLAVPARIPAAAPTALLVGVLLLLVARPVSVAACLLPLRPGSWSSRRLGASPVPAVWTAFIAWSGLRGAVPIVFATIPLGAGLADGELIFDTTFLLVVVLTLVQAPTMPFAARRLGLVSKQQASELTVEVAPLDSIRASLLDLEIPAGSRLVGAYIVELPLPSDAVVSLIVRDGRSIVPDRHARVRAGDRLLVVTTEAARTRAEAVFQAVSERGRLAGWIPPGN